MPVNIRQLNIKIQTGIPDYQVNVKKENKDKKENGTQKGIIEKKNLPGLGDEERKAIISDCVSRVLEVLQESEEC